MPRSLTPSRSHTRLWSRLQSSVFAILFVGWFTLSASAEDIRIATWNVHEGMSVEKLANRANDLKAMAAAVKPDVLLVQEVTSLKVVEAVRDLMGLKGYYCACSDFNPGDQPDFAFFEVGIISRWPLDQVIEFDTTPDNADKPGSPDELPINPLIKLGIRKPPEDVRGFLWARIDQIKLTTAVVHLKSSRGAPSGPEDRMNAQKREYVAAAMAAGVVEDRMTWPGYSCILGGDLNVGHSDLSKNGSKLDEDFDHAAPGQDGYDDTHAIFRGGVVYGLKMHNLVGYTREPTFPAFPSTPIDNLYVTGPGEKNFSPATIVPNTFGSDHRPVVTVYRTQVLPAVAKKSPATQPAPTPVTAAPKGVIPAAEARKYIAQSGTVEFTVVDGTLLGDGRFCFLNSSKDRTVLESFTAVLPADAIKAFAAKGIADPSQHFRGKKIRVTGKIHLRRDACQIIVEKPEQIELVAGN
jgi:endonuclease/exonuclease/phosphatase family metal-dependent hydrolase